MATNYEKAGDGTAAEPAGVYVARDEDRLPWLESAEDDYRAGPAWGTIGVVVAFGLLVVALAVYGIHWYRTRPVDTGSGALIAAPPGDYKVKPDDPGGMKVGGEGETALATSQGGAPGNASINLGAAPEAPVQGRQAAPGPAPKLEGTGPMTVPASGGKLTATRPGVVSAMPTAGVSGGALVQLGSFPSEAAAQSEWAAKAKRFGYLAPLGHAIERAEVKGSTVFRLRVNAGSAGAANTLCAKLKVAGEACFVPN